MFKRYGFWPAEMHIQLDIHRMATNPGEGERQQTEEERRSKQN
jgi:hypothetical protein